MEIIDINNILNRKKISENIKSFFKDFDKNKHDLSVKRGIYVYGNPGTGKTTFIENILKEINYDIIKYDAGDIRNKSIIDTITKHNMADKNVLSLMQKNTKKIAIIMDEIDGMNNGDKGGINSLIKLIRPKKTKKQKLEEITLNPIICIGNYHMDKKIKELMKVCNSYELKNPTNKEIEILINKLMPTIESNIKTNLLSYIQGDLRKLESIVQIYNKQNIILNKEIIQNIFQPKTYNEDSKKITQNLINNNYPLDKHNNIMNETDRTIVGLLWHENIVDCLSKFDSKEAFPFYNKVLDNICFADYIDRITFQKQIWQFNEMSSLIKTFYNNKLFNEKFPNKNKFNPSEVRFTKVLTKYSTEYNNYIFIQNLCFNLNMDQKDLFSFFIHLRENHEEDELFTILENYEISKLDINRMYRYIDKFNINSDDISDDVSISSV
uniref:AAA+ ATPase domain-containing protein n=1 Tax=viral metagenome TaxID=1070528 RepID=A0A6C0CJK1_9ZZZZ